ncbi:MAG TPA: pyruvate kinase [Candidatus Omnitrophica bacterium]|nr:pyruvate kinase [Candidatus Omnitrophota bacterium]
MVKTKIIATLGPASDNPTILRKMMLAGLDVARLNFSHGTHQEHLKRIQIIRDLNKKYRRSIKILQDLEGYRIRIGRFKGIPSKQISLKKKQPVLLTNREKTSSTDIIPFDYPGSLKDFKTGQFIYIDDGLITLQVKAKTKSHLKTEVIVPGVLKEHKGINIPEIRLKFRDITEKDKADISFGIENNVNFIAQSFVRTKKDILKIRELLGSFNCKVIAKIENREGINNIDGILKVSDGIMIARGDMGVSLPIYQVPVWQKILIKKCKEKNKFVITATQMLETMTERARPTRAEASDVANAIFDGSDYVMLSAETAAGLYPVESVAMMNEIIKFTEGYIARARQPEMRPYA